MVSKKLSNTKRKHGNGSLKSLRGEVADRQETCSTGMILNYGHSEEKTKVIAKKTHHHHNKTLSSGIN